MGPQPETTHTHTHTQWLLFLSSTVTSVDCQGISNTIQPRSHSNSKLQPHLRPCILEGVAREAVAQTMKVWLSCTNMVWIN